MNQEFVVGSVVHEVLDQLIGSPVVLYEEPGLSGRSLNLAIGEHRLPSDFNDVAASIHVAPGYVAWIFEHADTGGGYGISVDLMEDCPDLSMYGLSKQVSFVNVFASTTQVEVRDHREGSEGTRLETQVWVRGAGSGESYRRGHWERPRAAGSPNAAVGAVSPPYPAHEPALPAQTTLTVSGPATHISALGPQDAGAAMLWQRAVSDQLGVLGSDYRGPEVIGSAAFQRDPNNWWLENVGVGTVNFWYPQDPRKHNEHDHRDPFHKRTCVGTMGKDAHLPDIEGTYRDQDLDIYILPDPPFQHLISEGHPREYSTIMAVQYNATAHQLGQPSCDRPEDIEDFTYVEAEIQASGDLANGVAEGLRDRINAAADRKVGVYGPWIYDLGHCCHSEIHPSEQIWFRQQGSETIHHLNLICDASKRYWWRDQMDDGTKLKPWGAPPINGVFAIAFEIGIPDATAAVPRRLDFSVTELSKHNVAKMSSGTESQLFYNGTMIARVVPASDSLKVSFENIGIAPNGLIRGFVVLEASVGALIQKLVTDEFPAGADVNSLSEEDERKVFDKQEGHYMFSVTQRVNDSPIIG